MKEITVEEIWARISESECKPKPRKNVLVEVIDKIKAVAESNCVDDIVKDLVLGETAYKKIKNNLGVAEKNAIHDNMTARKNVLPLHVNDSFDRLPESGKIYYQQRFIMEHGLPPYQYGQKNMPDKNIVKPPRVKKQHHCPKCKFVFSG